MLLKRRLPVDQWVAASDAVFEALGEAIMLVSSSGYVVYASPLTKMRMGQDAGLGMLRGRRLWHADSQVREQLAEALMNAATQREGVGQSAQMVVQADGQPTICLHFAKAHEDMQSTSDSLVYVRMRVAEPSERKANMTERLRGSFNITSAEAGVLGALAVGCLPKQYALQHEVSIHTVRKQISMLMRKMDCSRQVELVSKALAVMGAGSKA